MVLRRTSQPTATLPPGMHVGRFMPTFHYELLICGLRGHVLAGLGDADVTDDLFVREMDGIRWHRCLRCDSWLPMPEHDLLPTRVRHRHRLGRRADIALPLRGRPLRDKVILRLIAVDRVLHFLVLGALSMGLFLLASHKGQLRSTFERVAGDLHLVGKDADTYIGIGNWINHVLSVGTTTLYLSAAGVGALAVIELVEAVGLWQQKRWAEYLTVVVTCFGLPYEVWELAHGVSVLKLLAFAANVAIVVYLLFAKRLFGLRGGEEAILAGYERDLGWQALERTAPRTREAGVAPVSAAAEPAAADGATP